MNTLSDVLSSRYQQIAKPTSSIEDTVGTTNTSIELPAEIEALVTGDPYWVNLKRKRYLKLIREGHRERLLALARMAHERATEQPPAHWFARVCSVKQWERTLAYLAKLAQVQATAERVARRLATPVSRFIYQQVWHRADVERWAALAADTAHTKPGQSLVKHFAWLCRYGPSLSNGRLTGA